MSDGGKPPLTGPRQVQMPGGGAQNPRASPLLPHRLDGAPLRPPASPFAHKEDSMEPQKPPNSRIPIPMPPDPSQRVLIEPRKPIKPTREQTASLRRGQSNPAIRPFGEPLPPERTGAPISKPPLPAASQPVILPISVYAQEPAISAQEPDLIMPSSIPVDMDIDWENEISFPEIKGPLESTSRDAFRVAYRLLSEENPGARFTLEGKRVMLEGMEIGEISLPNMPERASMQIWLEALGITKDAFPYSAVLDEFKAYTVGFLTQAVNKTEHSAIVADAKGVKLCFYKSRGESSSHSFPLKRQEEKETNGGS